MEQLNNKHRLSGYWKGWVAIAFLGVFALTQILAQENTGQPDKQISTSSLEEQVFPSQGITVPVYWNNLGKKLVDNGVIDKDKFESLYSERGGLNKDEKELLYGERNGKLKINKNNSRFILNLLWGFGLANKNPILEYGPMQNPEYGGAGNFASTGGWTLAKGGAMIHYSKHKFIELNSEQQKLVEQVSKNIYRPCCGNPTYFPDCNHGMAMLGLLELMAKEGMGEKEMYNIALKVNSYWFPNVYLTIAKYFGKRGVSWNELNSKDILSSLYSSAQGYRQILEEVTPPQSQSGGGGCGI